MGTLEQRPLWTPLAHFFGSARIFFMGKVVNLTDLLGWVEKKSPRVRGGLFFGSGEVGDGVTF